MKTHAKALVRKQNLQKYANSTPARKVAGPGPRFNALKHGLRSAHVLLPGDNVAEFRKLRDRLFRLHQPRTIAEAKCVETLAANEWRAGRCRVEQRFFKTHLGMAADGHPDAAGYLCDPDLHQLHHKGTDCRREERSLEISMSDAQTTLTLLQKQRTQNLIPGRAAALEDYTVFLAEGEPVVEQEWDVETAPERGEGPEAPTEAPGTEPGETSVTPSADGGKTRILKRGLAAPATGFPKHWNRRQRRKAMLQRRAAARRMGKLAPQRQAG